MRSATAAPTPTPHTPPARTRYVSLAVRLLLVILVLATGLLLILLAWLQPRTAAAFTRLGADFLQDGATAMHELSHEQSSHNCDLLVDALRASVIDRDRALAELQLDQYGGDAAAIRTRIAADDARRSAHERQNVLDLTNRLQQRAEASIDARLRALRAAQQARTDEFVADLRDTHLTLVGLTLGAVLVVLGVGLRQLVLRPTRALRAATQRVAAGALDMPPPPPPRDELGLLAHDFAAMTVQLRDARAAEQRLLAGLEQQVAEKTAHLERALAELRNSHHQLAQAERLAALGTLAGGIAHEFHNVIGGIRGCAAELAADEADADRKETLAVIQRAADRGSAIVQQLQRFSRRSVERLADVDVAAVVADALRLCEPAARQQRITVQREVPAGLVLRADADGLHQVLVNLILNAVQAMPDGGTLRVAAARDGGGVALVVADSGAGIASTDLPHLFEPFFTTKTGRDGGRPGTGLGLSVSWGIVAAHGGRIDVASAPGQGSTFTVRLPSTPPPSAPTAG